MPPRDDHILYLILPESEYWCRSILPGLADYVRRHTDFFLRNDDSIATVLKEESHPAGIIGSFDRSHSMILEMIRMRVPLVNISGRVKIPGVPTVTHDNLAVGEMAAAHLLERGFKHFAYVGVGDHPLSNDRYAGFARRLKREGYSISKVERRELAGDEMRLQGWLKRLDFPLGIFAAHDRCARKVCWEAEHMGYRIPDEIGVIGVDNDPYQCELSRTPMSSVALRFEELGTRAAKRLHDTIRGKCELPDDVLVAPAGVVERLSTDHLAVGDDLVRRALQNLKLPRDGRLGVAGLAQILGVSKSSLEKRFKAATGKTVFEEIHRFRMERARHLVDETFLSVDEISEQIGIADSKRFVGLFKERFGATPNAYRKERRLE